MTEGKGDADFNSRLDKDTFDEHYKDFKSYLNFDFSPIDFGETAYNFTEEIRTAF